MRARAVGEDAVLIDCADLAEMRAVHAEAVRRAPDLQVTEIVPAARSVLLDGVPDTSALLADVATWSPRPVVVEEGPLVTLPVTYDGPDLEDVAALWGVDAAEVAALHQGVEHVVAFCGFAPGFAYCSGLPEDRAVPRRREPRARVPAGSVGLAGALTGIYPRESPGGWQLIGRTPTPLWRPNEAQPALLQPGTRVRFRETPRPSVPQPKGSWMPERSLQVLDAGTLTTVQDLGRTGHAHLGVPRSGALDEPALRLANRLVGNPESAAGLEITLSGLRLRLSRPMSLAVTGAECAVRVGGRLMEFGAAISAQGGSEVELGPATRGARTYLAVGGGIVVPQVLGSRSTDLLTGLGPDPVRAGDVLPVGPASTRPDGSWSVPRPPAAELGLRLGPRDDWFTEESVAALDGASYVVGADSNRIGLRLTGRALVRSRDDELPSEGMVLGAVQVPPSGQPLVFLNDHPTTGGYPVVGVVRRADLPVCAQARPGDRLTLRLLA